MAKIDDLHQDNVRLTREISKWERRVATESERRRAAELEAGSGRLCKVRSCFEARIRV